MSSNLNNSSTDQSTSSIGTVCATYQQQERAYASYQAKEISKYALALLSFLSISIKSKFPVSELDINPESSPQLAKIKVETNRIPQAAFKMLRNILQLTETHHSTMKEFQVRAQNNEPIPTDVFNEQEKLMRIGGNTIIDEHHKFLYQEFSFVDNLQDDMDSKARDAFNQSENIQRQQGQLNVIKDNIVPSVSATNPALAPVESAGNVAVGLITYSVSGKLDDKLKALEILEKTLRDDSSMASKTKEILKEYQSSDNAAKNSWIFGCEAIYGIQKYKGGSKAEIIIPLQRINLVEENLSQFIVPIKNYLAEIYQFYAPGITVEREVKSFCDFVPRVLQELDSILSAKAVIKSNQRIEFEKTVKELGLAIYEYLQSMRDTFDQNPIDPRKQEQFLKGDTFDLCGVTAVYLHDISKMLDNHTSKRKIRKAEENRNGGDRYNHSLTWKNRPLVTTCEVQGALGRVKNAISVIYEVTMASTGKYTKSIGGEIEIARDAFDRSNPSLSKFHQVLNEDAEEGLKRFRELQIEEEPSSRIRRIRECLRFNHKKC